MTSININENYKNNELLQDLKTLLGEQIEGIALNELENVYKKKFSKSLFVEFIKLVFPNELDNQFSIISNNQHNGTSDVIKLINQESNEQIEDQLLQQITASGVVSDNFHYNKNPIIDSQSDRFSAYFSNIDRKDMLFYMQPECDLVWMDKLTGPLHEYYSLTQSEKLIVQNPQVGLACVSKYDEVYHRTIIKEIHPFKYVVQYVDIGLTMIIEKNDKQFKHLLNCFAECPCIAFPCCLVDIEFKLENSQMPLETYQKLKDAFGSGGPFIIMPYNRVKDVLNVRIYDYYGQCLNTLLVQGGLACEAVIPTMSDLEDESEVQKKSSEQLVNGCHENSGEEVKTVGVQDSLSNDYCDEENEKNTLTNQSLPDEYAEYDEQSSSPSIIKSNSQHSNSSSIKSQNNQSNRNDYSSKSTSTKQSIRADQRDQQTVNEQSSMKITINRNIPSHRIFTLSLKGISSNNERINQEKISSMTIHNSNQKKDGYAEWMRCSWSKEQSLWSSDKHKIALLKYIGRIYNQVTNMYRIFTQLQKTKDLDELDILNKLIINAKQRQQAQSSFNKWQDNSRINRRIEDLKIIFNFNSNSAPSKHPFIIETNGCERIIEGQNIKSYFDVGCGDGTITAEIGRCLHLSKTDIFGGDVFEVRNENITYIKLSEDRPNINLSADRVDLVTSFVTFHHVPELQKTLVELVRILRVGGYLIIREHDCENKQSLSSKYLNFVHAIMMIAGVGEFAGSKNENNGNQLTIDKDYHGCEGSWEKQKWDIIEYTKSIKYRSCSEWRQELENVGFRHRATLRYGANGSENPQNLFYAVYQLEKKLTFY